MTVLAAMNLPLGVEHPASRHSLAGGNPTALNSVAKPLESRLRGMTAYEPGKRATTRLAVIPFFLLSSRANRFLHASVKSFRWGKPEAGHLSAANAKNL